jgi:hypothetical protein
MTHRHSPCDRWKHLVRWGCHSNHVRSLYTVLFDTPVSSARLRRDQSAVPRGLRVCATKGAYTRQRMGRLQDAIVWVRKGHAGAVVYPVTAAASPCRQGMRAWSRPRTTDL